MTELNDSLLSGKLDLAAMVATDLVILTTKVPNIKTIMVTDYSGQVDGILTSNKITKPEDLRGKKIAREDVPYEVIFLGELLKLGEMTEKNVQIVSMTAEAGAAAFAAGKVDAVNRSSDLNLESSVRSGGRILLENGKIKQLGDAATLIDSSLIQSL